MNQATAFGRDVYLRHTGVDGNSYVQDHRAWDAERLVAARQRDAEAANARAEAGKPRLAKVEQITQEQYLAERRAK